MSAPFTPEQEARVREIVREEIAADDHKKAEHAEALERRCAAYTAGWYRE